MCTPIIQTVIILDQISFPDARETGHNTTETNLFDTEVKELTNNTVIRHDSKLLTLADIETLLNNTMAKS